jgi:mannose-6-phosphate isomerase
MPGPEARPADAREGRGVDTSPLGPLRFEPILKRLIWGGRRLGDLLDKPLGPESDYAESWEISDHEGDVSRVASGPLAGVTLRDLVRERPDELLGPALADRKQFPLLVKFIDANQPLSVQVHPDDEQARVLAGDNGKTEAWVIVHAEPGSLIYAGLRPGVGRDEFAQALKTGQVEPHLHRFEARPGQCVFIPAGTVHAIGAGIVLAEIQQMSDTTFRVFDWGRVGPDGKPRQLHIDEALVVIEFARGPVNPVEVEAGPVEGGTCERLVRCPQFTLGRLRLTSTSAVGDLGRFTILIGMEGSAEVRSGPAREVLQTGETLLLPAGLGRCDLAPREGPCVVLTATVS